MAAANARNDAASSTGAHSLRIFSFEEISTGKYERLVLILKNIGKF
jgi:hypothetical protein